MSDRIRVVSVVGARPNFMKIAPLHRALVADGGFESIILHTGQHYDEKMSDIFFRQLELPEPDIYLGVGSGSHADQTARIMIAFDGVLMEREPDLVVVVGDVNSTLACSVTSAKRDVPLAHVEAGLRSRDRRMPEELNRIVTDQMSDLLFVTEQAGVDNLAGEGIPADRVHLVGNVMIDTLLHFRERAGRTEVLGRLGLEPSGYALVTLHRPSNVDDPPALEKVVELITKAAEACTVVFPVHPRTRARLADSGRIGPLEASDAIHLLEPVGYLEFLNLMQNAAVVLTDSGGIQEETTVLGIPCLTVRENTERPVTIEMGTNELVPLDADFIVGRIRGILEGGAKDGQVPPLWDGHAAERIVQKLNGVFADGSVGVLR